MCGLRSSVSDQQQSMSIYVSMLVKRVGIGKYISLEAAYVNLKGGL